jgi:hypothetical protein
MPAVSGYGSSAQYQMYQAYSFRLFSRANMFFREKSIFMVGTFSSEGPSDRIERSNEMHVAKRHDARVATCPASKATCRVVA